MRRHISTSNFGPAHQYVCPNELTSFQPTIGIYRLYAFSSTLFEVLPISENSQHYTLFTENTTCLCWLLTSWKRNKPQPPRWNHQVNTKKTHNQRQNGWKLIKLKIKTDLAAHTQSHIISWETWTSDFSKGQLSFTYHWLLHSQTWTSSSHIH